MKGYLQDDGAVLIELSKEQLRDVKWAIMLRAAELVQQGKYVYEQETWRTHQERLDKMNDLFEEANKYHELVAMVKNLEEQQ
jgi:enolase